MAGFLLAQLGADVIAVEPPGGSRARHVGPFAGGSPDPERALGHWAYNRGKRSVVADDGATVERLAATADVLLTCGAFDVDLDALRAANPELITVSLTPFGSGGPKGEWIGTDLTINAAAGEMSLNGDLDRPPVRITAPQVWANAGAEAACAVLLALTDRRVNGGGQHIDVSAQEAMMLTAQGWLAPALCDNPPAQRSSGGLELLGQVTFRFVYECADGHITLTFLPGVLVGPFTNKVVAWANAEGALPDDLATIDWIDLLEGRELDEVADLVRRTSEALAKAFATRTKANLFAMAQRDRLLLVPVTTPADVLDNEHYAAREFWDEVEVAGTGPVRFPGPWAKTTSAPLRRLGPPPRLGEHTDEILAALGSTTEGRSSAAPSGPPATSSASPAARRSPAASSASPVATAPTRPLEGVRIVDFTWVYAGPFATRMLAYYGAEVIRVESQTRPDQVRSSGLARVPGDDGPEGSQQWHSINADKKSLQLNLKVPESRQVVLDLAATADIVIDAFSPGVLERSGLSHADMRDANPGLIVVSTTLFGFDGPLSATPGFGNMAAAMGGYYELTGWPDRIPAGPFLAYTDATSPRLTAAVLLAALDHRARTGEGMSIDFSQAEGGVHFLTEAVLDQEVNGHPQSRLGNADRFLAPHGVHRCGAASGAGPDDPATEAWIAVACETDEQWRRLAAEIGLDGLAALTTAERLDRAEELEAAIGAWTDGRDPVELQARLQALGVPAHRVQNSPEVITDPQLAHRDHFHRVPHDVYGHSWAEQYGFRLSRADGTPRRAGPLWGEHTYDLLADLLGYDADRIAELAIADALE